eukprot:CAMPEP_0202482984 /NCGR_PEP_ID=MMETSP1361-20130828/2323_1 /ASSEMBLY_ACC=CAM_ASM_000849 /TAXON_ID=210615 /ORGANISM="Staurosira complex sp., Strain CCMP2646" /LENGTH=419 /DNA_ID=CAMNT_0049111087 /DNA_START=245 /DNA_END=1504 /DNA_ORIENTATION=+
MVHRPGSIVNIAGTTPVDDPEYRYKMPVVYGKIEGRGNGIKTVIPNISDVALALHRNPAEVNKFFGCELGAQTTYNQDTDRAVVNGAHTDATLQDLIHRYCQVFVICPQCGLPETDYKIKNECIYHKCAACGNKEMVDMSHKLCTFILAQDKKAKKEAKSKSKKDGKDGKKKDKKKSKSENGGSGSDEDAKKKKKDKKKEKKAKKEKKDKKSANDSSSGNHLEDAIFGDDNKDEFGDDVLEEASLASEPGVDDAGAMLLAVEATRKYLEENPEASADDIVEVVTNQQMASALKTHDKIQIVVRAAITPMFFQNKEVEKYAPVVSAFTKGKPLLERQVIAALEAICVDKPKNFPVLIKQFYDEDALEEDTILEWAAEGRNEYTLDEVDEEARAVLRGEAEPVVVWLQDADSDEESGSDDE